MLSNLAFFWRQRIGIVINRLIEKMYEIKLFGVRFDDAVMWWLTVNFRNIVSFSRTKQSCLKFGSRESEPPLISKKHIHEYYQICLLSI